MLCRTNRISNGGKEIVEPITVATVFGSEVRVLLTRTDIEEVDFEFDPIISLI